MVMITPFRLAWTGFSSVSPSPLIRGHKVHGGGLPAALDEDGDGLGKK